MNNNDDDDDNDNNNNPWKSSCNNELSSLRLGE